jgi:hypothetical protein
MKKAGGVRREIEVGSTFITKSRNSEKEVGDGRWLIGGVKSPEVHCWTSQQ